MKARHDDLAAARESGEIAEERLPEIQEFLAEYQRATLKIRKDEEAEDALTKGGVKIFVDMNGRRLSS